jgi:hypothetical protein
MKMNDERWGDLKEKLHNRFGEVIEEKRTEDHEDDVGHVTSIVFETLELNSELGHLKIERVTRPKILDKVAHYHKGAGVAKVEYVVSETEKSYKINVYKKDEAGEWQPLDLPAERLSF